MKILCDVCGKGEASFYCAADEASLCAACDHRVHHANKLAGKHHRFSLLHPSPNQTPLCDIGVTLSSESPAESASTNLKDDAVSNNKAAPATAKGTIQEPSEQSNSNLHFSTSSISEYLIETLPGWHVEDLLDSSSPSPSVGRKSGENDPLLPSWDADFHSSKMGLWVPQVQVPFQSSVDNNCNHNNVTSGLTNGCRKRSELDNSFAVPQIIPPPSNAALERSRYKYSSDS